MTSSSFAASVYTLRGIHTRVKVSWDFESAPGAGDRHAAVVRGSRARIEVRQGPEQQPEQAPKVVAAKEVAQEQAQSAQPTPQQPQQQPEQATAPQAQYSKEVPPDEGGETAHDDQAPDT